MSFPELKSKSSRQIIIFYLGLFSLAISACIPFAKNFAREQTSPSLATSKKSPTSVSTAIGTNLTGISYWSTEIPFLDAFKSASPWITQKGRGVWNTEESHLLDLDENGWVKSLPAAGDGHQYNRVGILMFRMGGTYPGGKYVVLYEGEGTIEYGFDAKKDSAASRPGRDIIEVIPSDAGIWLQITATDPNNTGNYIRNIRVIQAKYENLYKKGEIFNPKFIEKTKKFKTLRFMDWMGTNNSQQKEWAERPKPDTAFYSNEGVPPEINITLSNKLKADPWFNMPHQATDEYMTNFAKLVKKNLDPQLKIYVELSNEVWNPQFKQQHYALRQGKARWGDDKWDAGFQWYGMRTAQMCEIWKTVFGKQRNRVACVISTQTAWKEIEKAILDCPYWVAEENKPCYQHGIDAYAIAGYFNGNMGSPKNASMIESWLVDPDGGFGKAIQQLRVGGLLPDDQFSLQNIFELFQYHASVAQEKGLQLIVYEGGQHIAGTGPVQNNQNLTKFFIELNRHPEMYNLYTELLNYWQRAGGGLFVHFQDISKPNKYGSFGALEYVEQASSPKYKALMDFIERK